MYNFRVSSKKLYQKVKDSMVILSEREANSILLSSDNLTRNIFIVKQKPKETLKNENWFNFLIDQLNQRHNIKHNLYHVIPDLFPDLEKQLIIKLTTFMFTEIKRKRRMIIKMSKNSKK